MLLHDGQMDCYYLVMRVLHVLMSARQLYALSAVSHTCEEEDVMEVGCCCMTVKWVVSFLSCGCYFADVSAAAVRVERCEPHLRGRRRHGGGLLLYDSHVAFNLLINIICCCWLVFDVCCG
jgi:hypothetical protein